MHRHTLILVVGILLIVLLGGYIRSAASTGELDRLKAQVETLQAREDIRALMASYGRTLDNRDFDAFGRLYARDAEYLGGGGAVARGPQAIAQQLKDVITANASGANLHFYSNERIEVADDLRHASATSRGAFYVQNADGGPVPLMFATYEDDFVLEDGAWKFQRREVIGDIPGPANETRKVDARGIAH